MKVETKLNVSTGILVVTMFVSACVAQWRLAEVMKPSGTSSTQRASLSAELQHLHESLAEAAIRIEFSILETPDTSKHPNADILGSEVRNRLNTDVVELQRIAEDPESGADKARMSEISRKMREFAQVGGTVERSTAQDGSGRQQAQVMLGQQVLPLLIGLQQATESMIQTESALRNQEVQSLRDLSRNAIRLLWIAAFLSALLLGSRSLLSARRLKAVTLIANRAAAIASGDLTGTDLGIKSVDQIGALARGMQSMQIDLASVIGTVASTRRHTVLERRLHALSF